LKNDKITVKKESGKIKGMARAQFKVIFQLMPGGN
jgi:hypothetical protein